MVLLFQQTLDFDKQMVIPSKFNRKIQYKCDAELYKVRYVIENVFIKLKRWRGTTTRYTDRARVFFLPFKFVVSLLVLLRIVGKLNVNDGSSK